MKPLLYTYDEQGYYVCTIEATNIDPVRSKREERNVYTCPRNATFKEIPECGEGERLRFVDGEWITEVIPVVEPEEPPEWEPSDMDKLRADVDYIAAMTGIEL